MYEIYINFVTKIANYLYHREHVVRRLRKSYNENKSNMQINRHLHLNAS